MSKLSQKILELVNKNYSHNQIKKELNCAISTISYHYRKNGFGKEARNKPPTQDEILEMQRIYNEVKTIGKVVNLTKWNRLTVMKYVTQQPKSKMTLEEKKKRVAEHVSNRRRKIKIMAVEYKGGKCVHNNCGYNKCISALEFHHLDPNEKDFSLAYKGNCVSWEKVKNELDKCILVCANCHREIHEEMRN